MIMDLSNEVWAELEAIRDARIAAAVDPAGLDEEAVETAMRAYYAYIGEAAPEIVWADGPNELRYTDWGDNPGHIGEDHWWPVRNLGQRLWDQLEETLREQFLERFGPRAWSLTPSLIWSGPDYTLTPEQELPESWVKIQNYLWGEGKRRGQKKSWLRMQLAESQRYQVVGGRTTCRQHATSMGLLTRVPNIAVDPDEAELLRQWSAAMQPAMWMPMRNRVVVLRHHTSISLDADRRLHNPDGPAWAWADGTEIWALSGVRVPSRAVTTTNPAEMLGLSNTEQRRVAVENYGWDAAVDDLHMELVDADPDPHTGSLYRLPQELVDDPERVGGLLLCTNNSPHPDGVWHRYGLYTPPVEALDAPTAVGAQAALAGISPAEYGIVKGGKLRT